MELPTKVKKVTHPTLSARVPPDLIKRTKLFAIEHDIDVQDVVSWALSELLERHGG
uniref:hypothetical protein n=1 Tax=Pseudonocardia sp. CA-138482 TaxID=3240023 RepID=UPI003F490574